MISKSNYCCILLFLELKLGCLLLFSLTSKALTVVFQARGVIVYGSDQEVRCWKSLFVCLYGSIGTRRLEYLNKETFGLKQVVNLLFITPSFKQENRLIKRRQFV